MIYLSIDQVLMMQRELIAKYGGLEGVREIGLLISALEMPKSAVFGQLLHPTVFDQAAAYLFHIVKNHPFFDGNKRTGVACALTFLEINQIALNFDELEFEELVVKTAAGEASKKEISLFFENHHLNIPYGSQKIEVIESE